MDRRSPPPPLHLDVKISGVVLPTWVAVTLSVVAAFSAGIILLAVVIFKDAADSLIRSQGAQTREIRVLDLHVQDVENVLIRYGLATRDDFAKRPEPNPTPQEKPE